MNSQKKLAHTPFMKEPGKFYDKMLYIKNGD